MCETACCLMSSMLPVAPASNGSAWQARVLRVFRSRPMLRFAWGLGAVVTVVIVVGVAQTNRSGAQAAAPASRGGVLRSVRGASSSRPLRQAGSADSPFLALPALRVVNVNTREALNVRLYDAQGHVDETVARQLDHLLCDARDPELPLSTQLDRRTLQLLFRAAYHFHAETVQVISAYRAPRGTRGGGQHAAGKAIDFKLPEVKAVELAQYLRKTPRAGVGVYTHRRTQYVHVDTREVSHHWLDASPPNRRWREKSIGPRSMTKHDASYRREEDWPEGTEAFAPTG